MDAHHVKSEEQMGFFPMIQPMEKFPYFYEFTQLPASCSGGGGASSHYTENPKAVLVNNVPNPVQPPSSLPYSGDGRNSMAAVREMIYRMAAMRPIHIDPESVKAPKRRNVKISKDPQSVAARRRRERISERIRILQRIVPGGTKMDTASMLDEAIHYVKFLKKQVQSLQMAKGLGFMAPVCGGSFLSNVHKGKEDA